MPTRRTEWGIEGCSWIGVIARINGTRHFDAREVASFKDVGCGISIRVGISSAIGITSCFALLCPLI